MEGNSPLEWYWGIPPITRTYLTAVAVVAVLCQLEYVGPLQLYFNYRLVFTRNQLWRLVTPFLYFGPINFDFLFHMFFLMRYCRVLEEESFSNKPADFLFMLLFGGLIMLVVGPMLKATFLSTALTFMIVYVWARRNPQVMMNFLGIFNFTAPYMPWVLLGFSLLLSGQLPTADLIGIGAGHAYYYFSDVYPLLYQSHPLATPPLLKWLLNPPDSEQSTMPIPVLQDEEENEDENEDTNDSKKENENDKDNENGNEAKSDNESETFEMAQSMTSDNEDSRRDNLMTDEGKEKLDERKDKLREGLRKRLAQDTLPSNVSPS